MSGKLRAAFDQRYAASQSAQSLAHFKTDIAATQEDQVVGPSLQVECLDMGHRLGFA